MISGEDGSTTINTDDGSSSSTLSLTGAGDYVEIQLTSDSYLHIEGDQAIGVMQYCVSSKYSGGWCVG